MYYTIRIIRFYFVTKQKENKKSRVAGFKLTEWNIKLHVQEQKSHTVF